MCDLLYKRYKKIEVFVLFFVLAILYFIFTKNVRNIYPIHPWDESLYLRNGIAQTSQADQSIVSWGFLYSKFYSCLNIFIKNPEDLYYGNLYAQTFLLTFLHFFACIKLKASKSLCLLSSFLVLISTLNLPTVSKPTHLNTSYLYLIFISSTYFSKTKHRVLYCIPLLIFSMYLRQDNIFILLLFLVVYPFLQATSKKMDLIYVYVTTLLFIYLCHILIGNPFSGGKTWFTFRDAFIVHKGLLGTYPSELSAVQVIRNTFHNANSILGAFVNNPQEFSKHFMENISLLPRHFFADLFKHFPISDWKKGYEQNSNIEEALGLLLIFTTLLAVAVKQWRKGKKTLLQFNIPLGDPIFLLLYVGIFIKTISTVGLLVPSNRYYLELSFFSIAYLTHQTSRILMQAKHLETFMMFSIPLLLLIFCPSHSDHKYKNALISNSEFHTGAEIESLLTFNDKLYVLKNLHLHPLKTFSNPSIPLYLWRSTDYTGSPFIFLEIQKFAPSSLGEYLQNNDFEYFILDEDIVHIFNSSGLHNQLTFFEQQANFFGYSLIYNMPSVVSVYQQTYHIELKSYASYLFSIHPWLELYSPPLL